MQHSQARPQNKPERPPEDPNNILASSSLIAGVLAILLCWFPCCGGVLPGVGVFLGILGLKTPRRTLSIIGIVLGALVLIVNIGITIALFTSGTATGWLEEYFPK